MRKESLKSAFKVWMSSTPRHGRKARQKAIATLSVGARVVRYPDNNDSKYLPQLIISFLPAGMLATPLCVARYLVEIEVLPSGVGNCFVIREYKGYIWKEPCEEYNNG